MVALIKNVSEIGVAGVFKLSKFISNHSDMLAAIPEEYRKIDLKDQDVLTRKIIQVLCKCRVSIGILQYQKT